MAKILLVEDNAELAQNVQDWLEFQKYRVEVTTDGADAMQMLEMATFDVIVLDWDLPKLPGIEVCRRFRNNGGTTPVLMLTGKDKVQEKVDALDAGADDYLTKPFHMNELLARLRALLRRGTVAADSRLKAGEIEIDRNKHEVYLRGEVVKLYPREYDLLEFFMGHPNVVHSAAYLMQTVWSLEADSSEGALRTCIKTLRKKLAGEDGECPIETVHGVGYKFRS